MVTARGVAAIVVAAIGRWRAERPGVLVVAIDGHGGAGKTTIATAAARAIGAAVVHTDDFFIPARAGAPLAEYYDWPRIRAEALEPLRAGRTARFDRFDW